MKKNPMLKSILDKLEQIEENHLGQLQGGFFAVAYGTSREDTTVNNCKGGTCKTNNCSGGNCVPGCGSTD